MTLRFEVLATRKARAPPNSFSPVNVDGNVVLGHDVLARNVGDLDLDIHDAKVLGPGVDCDATESVESVGVPPTTRDPAHP